MSTNSNIAQPLKPTPPKLTFAWGRRLPMVLQTEAAECGLASIAMVAGYHGHTSDLATLRQRFPISIRGSTLKDVTEMAIALNLTTRPLRLDIDELPQLQTPSVLHWDLNHFVVLKKVLTTTAGGVRGVVIHDPACGEQTISIKELSASFSGIALELSPMAQFVPTVEKQSIKIGQLLGKVVGLKRSMLQIFALAIAIEIFAITSPFFMQWVVDGAIVSADYDLLSLLSIGFAILMVTQVSVGAIRSWVVLYLSTHLNVQWLSNVFSHLIRLPVSYFEKRHLGDIVNRFQAVQQIQQTLTSSFIEGVLDGVLSIAMLAIMFIYSPTLAMIVVASVTIHALISWASFGSMRRLTSEQISLSGKTQSLFMESIRAVQSIKLFGAENDRQSRYVNAIVNTSNRKIQLQKFSLLLGTIGFLLAGFENVAVIWVGANLVMQSKFSVGMLFAFVSYKTTFSSRARSLMNKFIELRMLKLQAEQLADIVLLSKDKATAQNFHSILPKPLAGVPEIELRKISFRYSSVEPWVLKDVSFKVARGESFAITGDSGVGKTTLMKIMLGLLPPTTGEVFFRGEPTAQLGAAYRQEVAAVMQDDQLLSGSIAENICFFSQTPDFKLIYKCAESAAIDAEIDQMPMKYQSLIGDLGNSLSGGQKQRVQIARAFYKQPQILFFDEATSHLDIGNEAKICSTAAAMNLTLIAIAHRPAFASICDQTFKLTVASQF